MRELRPGAGRRNVVVVSAQPSPFLLITFLFRGAPFRSLTFYSFYRRAQAAERSPFKQKRKRSPRLAGGALPLPMARVRRTRVSAPRGTAAATGASPGAAVDNTSTVPAVPQSSKLSALSDFLLPELVALRLCAQRADSAARVAGLRGAARTPDCSSA